MPSVIYAQTQTDFVEALTAGPSEQIREVTWSVSAPYSAEFNVAKLDSSHSPYWDSSPQVAQPGQGSLGKVSGIRFKSFDPANPTTVLCTVYYYDDPIPQGFIAGIAQFGVNGQVTVGSNMITGIVDASGNILAGAGFTVNHTGAGTYTISFTTPFASRPVIIGNTQSGGNPYIFEGNSVTVNGFTATLWNVGGATIDGPFNFIAQAVA